MRKSESAELKKRLKAEGFEIYRTASTEVQLAERVRDNLIMDSGVSASPAPDGFLVSVTLRAQASHFPGADHSQMAAHARHLARVYVELGYDEESAVSRRVADPSNPEHTLDTSHELRLSRSVPGIDALFEELRQALKHPRSSSDED